MDGHELLDTAEAAQALRLRPQTLSKWRLFGYGPAYLKIGARVRYRRADVDAFIAGCATRSTASAKRGPGAVQDRG
jgi:hypothetical protein